MSARPGVTSTAQIWKRLGALLGAAFLVFTAVHPTVSQTLYPVTVQQSEGWALVERLRRGGLVLFFRHADTTGMPCDSSYRTGTAPVRETSRPRAGSRPAGSARPSRRLEFQWRIQSSPDPCSGRATLLKLPLAPSACGSRTACWRTIMPVEGSNGSWTSIGGCCPSWWPMVLTAVGAALVLEPGDRPWVIGIIMLAPIPERGFHGC